MTVLYTLWRWGLRRNFCAGRGHGVFFATLMPELWPGLEKILRLTRPGQSYRGNRLPIRIPLPDVGRSKIIAMEVLEHVEDPAQFAFAANWSGSTGRRASVSYHRTCTPREERSRESWLPPALISKHPINTGYFGEVRV